MLSTSLSRDIDREPAGLALNWLDSGAPPEALMPHSYPLAGWAQGSTHTGLRWRGAWDGEIRKVRPRAGGYFIWRRDFKHTTWLAGSNEQYLTEFRVSFYDATPPPSNNLHEPCSTVSYYTIISSITLLLT